MMLDVKLLENHFQFFILASAFHMMLDVKLFENHFQLPFHRMEWIPSVIPKQWCVDIILIRFVRRHKNLYHLIVVL